MYHLAKKNDEIFFDGIIMFIFGETKIAKEKFFSRKKSINISDISVNDMVVSK